MVLPPSDVDVLPVAFAILDAAPAAFAAGNAVSLATTFVLDAAAAAVAAGDADSAALTADGADAAAPAASREARNASTSSALSGHSLNPHGSTSAGKAWL